MTQNDGTNRPDHRLSAILLADIVSFSRLMDADEEGTYAAVQELRHKVAEPAMEKYHGRFVKFTGDGFLAEFPTVHDAVDFAVQVQRDIYIREKEVPEDKQIILRI